MKKILFATFYIMFATAPVFAGRGGPVSDLVTKTGDVLQFAIPLSALAYSSAIGDWQGAKQWGYVSGATLGTVYVMKYTFHEERPYEDEGSRGRTFPSGHTSFAFAGAGYWQMRYGWYVGAPMYAAAAFVGYSRNHARMHNWLDIATGASIGIGFNMLFTTRYNNENVRMGVAPTDGGAMFNFSARF